MKDQQEHKTPQKIYKRRRTDESVAALGERTPQGPVGGTPFQGDRQRVVGQQHFGGQTGIAPGKRRLAESFCAPARIVAWHTIESSRCTPVQHFRGVVCNLLIEMRIGAFEALHTCQRSLDTAIAFGYSLS